MHSTSLEDIIDEKEVLISDLASKYKEKKRKIVALQKRISIQTVDYKKAVVFSVVSTLAVSVILMIFVI